MKKFAIFFRMVLFFGLIGNFSVSAQSKKEQILTLQNRIDSISNVLSLERNNQKQELQIFNRNIDSLNKVTRSYFQDLNTRKGRISQLEQELHIQSQLNESQKKSFIALQWDYDLLRQRDDSLQKVLSEMALKSIDKMPVEPEMVFVKGGTFQMGSNSELLRAKPAHSVTLRSFSVGKYEVTQGQWKAIMGNNPSYFSGCENCPVENVSWNEVQVYIKKLNLKTRKNYRLPTEAEWEYAAKGGKQTKGYVYSGANNSDSCAWLYFNSGDKTHVVGGKFENELGLYDMTGNVWEWCSDWYAEYSNSVQSNPQGKSNGKERVLRGGSWSFNAFTSGRASDREYDNPGNRSASYGFRLVLP
jgi:formylglycine-generating enzyme required for sulfatase activity